MLVSDGADTGAAGIADAPDGRAFRLHGRPWAPAEPARDREALDLTAGRPAAAGSAIDLAFSTVGHGFDVRSSFDVRVLEDGRVAHGW